MENGKGKRKKEKRENVGGQREYIYTRGLKAMILESGPATLPGKDPAQ
jgi:hypothetical protein